MNSFNLALRQKIFQLGFEINQYYHKVLGQKICIFPCQVSAVRGEGGHVAVPVVEPVFAR